MSDILFRPFKSTFSRFTFKKYSVEGFFSSTRKKGIASALVPVMFLTVCPANLPVMAAETVKVLSPTQGQKAVEGIVADHNLPEVAAPSSTFSLPPSPSTVDLEQARLFEQPLFPLNGKASDADNSALAESLTQFAAHRDRSVLETFVLNNPQSPWLASILTNLGILEYQDGYFTTALNDWQQAWTLGKNETDRVGKLVIDRAVAELIKMNCRVGRVMEASKFLSETEKRPFQGAVANMMRDSIQAVQLMNYQPKDCFKCGPYALGGIASFLHMATPENRKILEDYRTDKQGVSLSAVLTLSAKMGLKMQVAKRVSGSELPLPNVVHWRLNHYGALLKEKGDRFLLVDPTFGHSEYVLADAVAKETDGYFLIPEGPLPSGWVSVSSSEASQVFGRGQTESQDSNDTGNTALTCNAPTPSGCVGMPQWSFHTMLTSLHIEDKPVGYQPPLGPVVNLDLTYDHRELNQPAGVINYSNCGPLWNFSWMSSITFDSANAYIQMGTGGTEIESDFGTSTQSYAENRDTGAVLVENSSTSYERDAKDGSKMVFGLADSAGRVYLTKIVDTHGNFLPVHYNSYFRICAISDALNQVTHFYYVSDTVGNAGYYLISEVKDPFGRYAQFSYLDGELQSITDAVGNQSSFIYGAGNFINTLTTPYGTTHFTYTLTGGNTRSLIALEPNGAQQRVDGVDDNASAPASVPSSQVPSVGNFSIGNMNYRNSYYWGRKAMQSDPGDYNSAHIYHFFHDGNNVSEMLEAEKQPLENWVFYDYQNEPQQTEYVEPGMLENITQICRVLDDGRTQFTQTNYSPSGQLMQIVDPLGRATSFSYYANGIDLYQVQQAASTGGLDLLATYTWDSTHDMLSYTDRAGERTSFTYSLPGQIQTITDALFEQTTFNYTGNYVTSVQGPISSALDLTTYAYDGDGRVGSITDGEGYELAYNYDNLDRLSKVTYPDSTYEQNTYTALDITQNEDRQGRLTRYTYNGLDQLTLITDANSHNTTFGWCSCGSLKSMTDANGHTTRWDQDLEGRTISKTYPDGSKEITSYENSVGRVHSVKDAKGQAKIFSYNVDDTLASVSYVNAQLPTAAVHYGYDAFYNRITSMQDGIGTTSYTYNPVTGSASPGAGKVLQVNGPWSNSAVTYNYDALGRVVSRSINGTSEAYYFDALGRAYNITNALGSFGYTFENDSNRISTMTAPNGEKVDYTYFGNSSDRRLTEIQNLKSDNTNISTFGYPTYNEEGTIQTWGQTIGAGTSVNYTLGYNNTDQLLSGAATGSSYSYSYDSSGNRTTETINGAATISTYNANNEIQQITPSKSGDKTYQWDTENRLVAINYTGTNQQTKLSYDGLNRCAQIIELVNGVVQSTRRFLWCGSERCEERDGYDSVTKRFFKQGEQIYGANYYFLTDHLGSIRQMTDTTGNVRASYAYDFYGRRTKLSGDLDADFGFTGLFYHQLSNLFQAEYRSYDPNTGRWLTRDPLGENGGINLYDYVNDNPINVCDPLGLCPKGGADPGGRKAAIAAARNMASILNTLASMSLTISHGEEAIASSITFASFIGGPVAPEAETMAGGVGLDAVSNSLGAQQLTDEANYYTNMANTISKSP
jgi:RHS repeat-associated protein